MRIRIAMQGWGATAAADTAEDIVAGVRLPWIELDGHRLSDGVIAAEFTAGKEAISHCRVTLELLGPIEIVYVDKAGKIIPGYSEEIDPVDAPSTLGNVNHETAIASEATARRAKEFVRREH